jgi:hypothetical protein
MDDDEQHYLESYRYYIDSCPSAEICMHLGSCYQKEFERLLFGREDPKVAEMSLKMYIMYV